MTTPNLGQTQNDTFDKFSQTSFDPVQFLNETLPALNLSSQASSTKSNRTTTLQSTSGEVQTFLTKLSAHSIRSSSELTSLTDEILRSGNRLAYEVEVLRGDANSLYELLSDSLKDDIARFVQVEAANGNAIEIQHDTDMTTETNDIKDKTSPSSADPLFIQELRTLGTVKSRLEAVIGVFGEALKWPVAPSEVSMASTLMSVSAPELGVVSAPEDDIAREYTRRLRQSITETLDSDGGGSTGLEAATKQVDNLREISLVWRGTAEEKARTKVVDGLARLVEERKKLLEARAASSRSNVDARSTSVPGRAGRIVEGSASTAAGLVRNLQKLRDEIYLD